LLHPKASYWELRSWVRLRFIYDVVWSYKSWIRKGYRVINDGAHQGRLHHYYVNPGVQISQLQPNFEGVRVIGTNGTDLSEDALDKPPDDPWFFYLCRAPAMGQAH